MGFEAQIWRHQCLNSSMRNERWFRSLVWWSQVRAIIEPSGDMIGRYWYLWWTAMEGQLWWWQHLKCRSGHELVDWLLETKNVSMSVKWMVQTSSGQCSRTLYHHRQRLVSKTLRPVQVSPLVLQKIKLIRVVLLANRGRQQRTKRLLMWCGCRDAQRSEE